MRIALALVLTTLCGLVASCRVGGDYSLGVPQASTDPLAAFDHSHTPWTDLLSRHIRQGRVDYGGLVRDREAFDAYLSDLQGVSRADLDAWSRDERFAFWINTYNAYTVRLIVENYPVCSIKDLGNPPLCEVFDKAIVPLPALHPFGANKPFSLSDLEHQILRERFSDARVHAAINCASASCPALLNEAFTADRLDEQLEGVMHGFVNDPTRNRLQRRGRVLCLSKIFDWFGDDFARDEGSVRAYVARYADPASAGGGTAWIAKARLGFQ